VAPEAMTVCLHPRRIRMVWYSLHPHQGLFPTPVPFALFG
jgi:hypothetical protein